MSATQSGSFAQLLRGHRIAAGLSQEALAERAAISLAGIAKLERGARQRPYRTTIALLAHALGITAAEHLELERAANRGAPGALSLAHDESTTMKLPVRLSSFVGRERDLEKIGEMLQTNRLVTLVGAGGIGKTRLAIRSAERFVTEDSGVCAVGAVWFVDVSVITEGSMVQSVIASSVGLNGCQSIDALVRYLRPHDFLLLVDNCEHLLTSVGDVLTVFLEECPGGRILATSRQALSLEAEHVYRVLPMRTPDRDALSADEVIEFDAIRLFRDRAEARDSRFELDNSVASAVVAICRRVDGMALGIELAAARTNVFSVTAIAERLNEYMSIAVGDDRTSAPRHKTMDALFNWSYELLDARERQLFRLTSIFADSFTVDLLKALSGEDTRNDVASMLAALVDKSLIQRDPAGAPRYRLLEPVRQYAGQKLCENAEYYGAARSHALALLALSEDFDARLELIPDHVWDASIERERDNFRAAFQWALAPHGCVDIALRLLGSRTATWSGFASGEVRNWIAAAREADVKRTDPLVTAKLAITEAKVAAIFGLAWLQNDSPDVRVDACRHALALQSPADRRAVGTAKYWLGVTLRDSGRYDEADTALREARAIARSEGAQNEYDAATGSLGAVRHGTGDIPGARALISEVLHRSERAGAFRMAAVARTTLAEIEFASGFVEEALRLNEQTTQHFRERSNLIGLPLTLCNAAACLVALKRYREAQDRAGEALRRSLAIGSVRGALWAMQHLAAAAAFDEGVGDKNLLARAVQLLGFVDEAISRRAIPRCFTEQREYDKMVHVLGRALGQDAIRRYMADGKAWPEERAIEEAFHSFAV